MQPRRTSHQRSRLSFVEREAARRWARRGSASGPTAATGAPTSYVAEPFRDRPSSPAGPRGRGATPPLLGSAGGQAEPGPRVEEELAGLGAVEVTHGQKRRRAPRTRRRPWGLSRDSAKT